MSLWCKELEYKSDFKLNLSSNDPKFSGLPYYYYAHLEEIHLTTGYDIWEIRDLVDGKVILDFGGGSGFFSKLFLMLGAKHVFYHDRSRIIKNDVAMQKIRDVGITRYKSSYVFQNSYYKWISGISSRNLDSMRNLDFIESLDKFRELENSVHMVWIASVLHGRTKKEIKDILHQAISILQNKGSLVIVDVNDFALSWELFYWSMYVQSNLEKLHVSYHSFFNDIHELLEDVVASEGLKITFSPLFQISNNAFIGRIYNISR